MLLLPTRAFGVVRPDMPGHSSKAGLRADHALTVGSTYGTNCTLPFGRLMSRPWVPPSFARKRAYARTTRLPLAVYTVNGQRVG